MVVIQYGIVSLEYFLDKMKPYELSIICSSLHLRIKESWEQARMIAYVTAQSQSTKKMKPTDIIKFAWEEKKTQQPKKQQAPMTMEDFERIKAVALEREKLLKEKGII